MKVRCKDARGIQYLREGVIYEATRVSDDTLKVYDDIQRERHVGAWRFETVEE